MLYEARPTVEDTVTLPEKYLQRGYATPVYCGEIRMINVEH